MPQTEMPARTAEQSGLERSRTHAPSGREQDTVLLVEDNQLEQRVLREILEHLGYRVVCAQHGRAALALLEREPISLVVSDWRMPEMSGPDLCRTLRADPAFGRPYFILITGYDTADDLTAGMDAGADDFISKPFTSEKLRVRLQAGAWILNETEARDLVAQPAPGGPSDVGINDTADAAQGHRPAIYGPPKPTGPAAQSRPNG